MPIPLVVWGAVIGGTAIAGLAKGYGGVARLREARERGDTARRKHERAVAETKKAKGGLAESAQQYGALLVRVNGTTLERMRELLRKLKKTVDGKELRFPEGAALELSDIGDFERKVLDPPADLAAVAGAVGTGSVASATAVGLVGLLGTASTGTAIGTLSGAAATNATLAWLGGGTLAAGGGGMAAGTIVLGGVAAAPALVVAGLVLSSKGEKAITAVTKYEQDVERNVETLSAVRGFMARVRTRIEELECLVATLNERTTHAISQVPTSDFDVGSDQHMSLLLQALQLTQALSEVMRTPVMDDDGNLSQESYDVQLKYSTHGGGVA